MTRNLDDKAPFSLPTGEGGARRATGGVLREAHPAEWWQEIALSEHPTPLRRAASPSLQGRETTGVPYIVAPICQGTNSRSP